MAVLNELRGRESEDEVRTGLVLLREAPRRRGGPKRDETNLAEMLAGEVAKGVSPSTAVRVREDL